MSKEVSLEKIKKFWPKNAPNINDIQKYILKYQNEIIVIKYGGNVLIDRNIFNNFIEDVSILNKLGLSIVIVHGGGPRIKRELDKENIQTEFINGLRVTDEKVIKIVEKVLIDFNNDIVSSINLKGVNAVSINTKSNNVINVVPEKKELGFVGSPENINAEIIKEILNKNQIPVVAPLGLDVKNQTFNINGDTAANAIAKKLKSRRLLLMTNVEDLKNLIDWNVVQGGMIPKIKNCVDAVENGVRGVVILDGRRPHSILYEIFSDEGVGTLIRK